MISISSELTTAIAANIRKPRVKVDVLWTDPFVQSGNTVENTDENNFSDLSDTVVDAFNAQIADTVVTTPHKWFVLDGNSILSDSTITNDDYFLLPSTVSDAANNQVGWYSESVSDGSGDFATAPTTTVDFGEDRALQVIRIVGEPSVGEYPVDFTVYVYNSSDVLLHTEPVTGNTDVDYSMDISSENITTARYMVLEVDKWSEVNTILKIVEFFGVIEQTFTQQDIASIDILEEIEADSGTAPNGNVSINEMHLDLQNIKITGPDGNTYIDPFLPDNSSSYLANTITPNVRFKPSFGFVVAGGATEWIPMGTFWSTDWDVSESRFAASVTARDRLDILRRNEFKLDKILVSYSLKEVAEYVLEHAKVNIPLNDLEYTVSPYLTYITVDFTWFGTVTYYEALAKIAEACMGRVYVNRDDEIVIEAFDSDSQTGSPDSTIDYSECFSHNIPINYSQLKNYVIVPVNPLTPEGTDGEIYTSDDITVGSGDSEVTETIDYGNEVAYVTDTESPTAEIYDEDGITVSITSEIHYPWGASITVSKLTGTSGTFKIRINGQLMINVGLTELTDSDPDSINLYGKREHRVNSNHLIQNSTIAQLIATALLYSLKDPRRDCTVEIPAHPEYEIGDISDIEVYSKGSVTDEFRIIRQQFKFMDALRVSITGRKTIDYGS